MSGQRSATPSSALDAFRAHLDVCLRCRKNPFDLCPLGELRLRLVAVEMCKGHVASDGGVR